jgi:hypothetical protein
MGAIELRDLVETITVSVSENGKGECKCSRMREIAWILRLRATGRVSYIVAMFAVFIPAEWKTLYQGTYREGWVSIGYHVPDTRQIAVVPVTNRFQMRQ